MTIPIVNISAKVLCEILANIIQVYSKGIIYHNQVRFISVMKRQFDTNKIPHINRTKEKIYDAENGIGKI